MTTYLLKQPVPRNSLALSTTLKFVAVGILWIVLSDLALFVLHMPGQEHFPLFHIEVLKGVAFVIVMGFFFFLILQRYRVVAGEVDQQNFFKRNPHPMWIYNLQNLKFLEVNDAAIAMYGYSREEFLSMDITQIRPAEEFERLQQAVDQLQHGFSLLGQWKHIRKDGSLLHAEVSAYSIYYNKQQAGLILTYDISSQVKAEEERKSAIENVDIKIHAKTSELVLKNRELEMRNREINTTNDELIALNQMLVDANRKLERRAEEHVNEKTDHLKRLMGQINDCVWSLDLTGKDDHYVSEAALKLFGVERHDILDRPNFWLSYVHPEDKNLVLENLNDLEKKHPVEFTFRLIDDGRKTRWINQQVRICYNEHGVPGRLENIANERCSN
jgi:PAS domain S-box-containing protein